MDLPLFTYGRRRLINNDSWSDDDSTYNKMIGALIHDNKDIFVKLINHCSFTELEDYFGILRLFMLTEDAAKCAAAVLNKETPIPDITDLIPGNPLCYSVDCGALMITALLFEKGFSADDRSHSGSSLADLLPLDVALQKVRRMTGDLPKNERTCAVQFTTVLFSDFMLSGLETLRLLAMKMRDIKHEFFKCLKEGKMVEVGALLLVARSRILSSSTGKGEFSSILEMYHFLSEEKTSYTNSKRLVSAAGDKLFEMEQTLVVLQIFDTIGDKLEALIRQDLSSFCRHKTLVAASLLTEAGFDVNVADIPTSEWKIDWAGLNDDFVEDELLYKSEIVTTTYEPFSLELQTGDYRAPHHVTQQKKSTGLSCDYCGNPGHLKRCCYKYKRDYGPSCDYCGKHGHLKSYCYKYTSNSYKKGHCYKYKSVSYI